MPLKVRVANHRQQFMCDNEKLRDVLSSKFLPLLQLLLLMLFFFFVFVFFFFFLSSFQGWRRTLFSFFFFFFSQQKRRKYKVTRALKVTEIRSGDRKSSSHVGLVRWHAHSCFINHTLITDRIEWKNTHTQTHRHTHTQSWGCGGWNRGKRERKKRKVD